MSIKLFKYGLLTGLTISSLLGFIYYIYFVKSADVNLAKIELTDLSGKKINTEIYEGKPLVINFWATWCGPCIEEMPDFEIVKKQYEGKVNFLFVSDDDLTKIIKFKERKGFDLEFARSTDLKELGINIRPNTYFFDKDGVLLSSHSTNMKKEVLEKKVIELLEN